MDLGAGKPSGSKETLLDRLAEADAGNFQISKRQLGATFLLCEDLVGLYRSMGSAVISGNPELTEGMSVALNFAVGLSAPARCVCGLHAGSHYRCDPADTPGARVVRDSPGHSLIETRESVDIG
jgi:hypothetical protein